MLRTDFTFHVQLDEDISNLCIFGTPYGRYKFLRKPYGPASAPEVFQQRFKEIFDIEEVDVYIDDIIVWGRTVEEHEKKLQEVFNVARKKRIAFQLTKLWIR